MKTENFDDAIRRKVESINHTSGEAEIGNIHKFVKANQPSFFHSWINGTNILVSVFGVVISSLLFLNYRQMQENNTLLTKMGELQTNLLKEKANAKTITLRDTIYLKNNNTTEVSNKRPTTLPLASSKVYSKSTTRNHSAPAYNPVLATASAGISLSANSSESSNSISKPIENGDTAEQLIDESLSNAKEMDQSNTETNGEEKAEQNRDLLNNKEGATLANIQTHAKSNVKIPKGQLDSDNNNPSAGTHTNVFTSKEKTELQTRFSSQTKVFDAPSIPLGKTLKTETRAKRQKNEGIDIKRNDNTLILDNDETSKSNVAKANDNHRGFPAEKDTKKPVSNDSLTNTISLNDRKKSDTIIAGKPLQKKNTFTLKHLRFQTGIGMEAANSEFGAGILGEVFLSKRFSINAGVKFLSVNNEPYRDDDDFNNDHHDFKRKYAQDLRDTARWTNIGIQATLVQLPIAFSYYQPLKKDFSLVFSVGTDLDLMVNQNLRYDLDDFDKPEVYTVARKSQIKHPPVVFNNLVFSTGIQKQWNHIVLQASPFVSPQLKNVEYKKDDIFIGLRFRAFYRF